MQQQQRFFFILSILHASASLLFVLLSRRNLFAASTISGCLSLPFLASTTKSVGRRNRQKDVVSLADLHGPITISNKDNATLGFRYNSDWTGTRLPVLDLESASSLLIPGSSGNDNTIWTMGRWPDVALRRRAAPVDDKYFGTETLQRVADALIRTAQANNAVGMAAQQCGIDASMVYLELPLWSSMSWCYTWLGQRNRHMVVWVNPIIVGRSPESEMKVWTEYCLVLPPTFRATVARDSWIDVEYFTVEDSKTRHVVRLFGETARAAQHELDHDRGILTLDHIDLEEMENDSMRKIEQVGHGTRQRLAFSR